MQVGIIGGGLTGLSTGFYLRDSADFMVFESCSRPGGLVRTEEAGGYRFDYTGHFLHFRNPENREFVSGLLGGELDEVRRESFISAGARMVPYPFQANLYHLPEDIRRECLTGFLKAARDYPEADEDSGMNFHEWMLSRFGEGIVKHFMLPYNEKLWSVHPAEMGIDWMGRFMPRPAPEDVLAGALGSRESRGGYNAVFYYPPGGIGVLPARLAGHLPEGSVKTGCRVEKVNAEKKTLTAGGVTYSYETLAVTCPLKEFVTDILENPGGLSEEAGKLRHSALLNVNLGWEGGTSPGVPEGTHWVYYPDKKQLFYRAGFPHAVSSSLLPAGACSCYTEISYRQGSLPAADEYGGIEEKVIDGLRDAGVIPAGADITAKLTLAIEPAYVIYDKSRGSALRKITQALESRGIYCGGRYGAWEYSTMEDAIEWGRLLALKCAG